MALAVSILCNSLLAINVNKSVLVPTQSFEYLGVLSSTTTMQIQVKPKYLAILHAVPRLFPIASIRLKQVIAGYISWVASLTSFRYPIITLLMDKVYSFWTMAQLRKAFSVPLRLFVPDFIRTVVYVDVTPHSIAIVTDHGNDNVVAYFNLDYPIFVMEFLAAVIDLLCHNLAAYH